MDKTLINSETFILK